MKSYVLFDNKETLKKWAVNAFKFTAPALVVFFAQLASGVELRLAFGVALLALWGLLADYLKKSSGEK